MSTPNSSPGTPPSPPTKRQRAKSFVKRIGRRGSQLFRRHHHDSDSPDKHSSPTISLLIADHTRSVLAISHPADLDEKHARLRSMSGDTTVSSSDSTSFWELKVNEDEGSVDQTVVPIYVSSSIGSAEEGQLQHESTSENTRDENREMPNSPSLLPSPSMASDEHTPTALSPPPTIVEPDPFLVDDAEDSMSEEESTNTISSPHSPGHSPAAEEISLTQPSTSSLPSSPLSNPVAERSGEAPLPPLPSKAAPSPDSEDDEEETPDLYIPALTVPTMFLPIPNVRFSLFKPLTWWLSKNLINYSCIIRQIR